MAHVQAALNANPISWDQGFWEILFKGIDLRAGKPQKEGNDECEDKVVHLGHDPWWNGL